MTDWIKAEYERALARRASIPENLRAWCTIKFNQAPTIETETYRGRSR